MILALAIFLQSMNNIRHAHKFASRSSSYNLVQIQKNICLSVESNLLFYLIDSWRAIIKRQNVDIATARKILSYDQYAHDC